MKCVLQSKYIRMDVQKILFAHNYVSSFLLETDKECLVKTGNNNSHYDERKRVPR